MVIISLRSLLSRLSNFAVSNGFKSICGDPKSVKTFWSGPDVKSVAITMLSKYVAMALLDHNKCNVPTVPKNMQPTCYEKEKEVTARESHSLISIFAFLPTIQHCFFFNVDHNSYPPKSAAGKTPATKPFISLKLTVTPSKIIIPTSIVKTTPELFVAPEQRANTSK